MQILIFENRICIYLLKNVKKVRIMTKIYFELDILQLKDQLLLYLKFDVPQHIVGISVLIGWHTRPYRFICDELLSADMSAQVIKLVDFVVSISRDSALWEFTERYIVHFHCPLTGLRWPLKWQTLYVKMEAERTGWGWSSIKITQEKLWNKIYCR